MPDPAQALRGEIRRVNAKIRTEEERVKAAQRRGNEKIAPLREVKQRLERSLAVLAGGRAPKGMSVNIEASEERHNEPTRRRNSVGTNGSRPNTRDLIEHTILTDGPISQVGITEKLGLSNGVASYHIDILAGDRKVRKYDEQPREGGSGRPIPRYVHKSWKPDTAPMPSTEGPQPRARKVTARKRQRRASGEARTLVRTALYDRGEASISDICKATGMHQGQVGRELNEMYKNGGEALPYPTEYLPGTKRSWYTPERYAQHVKALEATAAVPA